MDSETNIISLKDDSENVIPKTFPVTNFRILSSSRAFAINILLQVPHTFLPDCPYGRIDGQRASQPSNASCTQSRTCITRKKNNTNVNRQASIGTTTLASNVIEPDGQVHPGVSLGCIGPSRTFLKEHLSGRDFCSFFIVLEKIRDTRHTCLSYGM